MYPSGPMTKMFAAACTCAICQNVLLFHPSHLPALSNRYMVAAPHGLMVLEQPDMDSATLLEIFLQGKVFQAQTRVVTPRRAPRHTAWSTAAPGIASVSNGSKAQPPLVAAAATVPSSTAVPSRAFLKLARRDGYVCAGTRTVPLCARVAPPVDECGDWWCRIVHPAGLQLLACAPVAQQRPHLDAPTPPAAVADARTLPFGAVLRAVRRVRRPGVCAGGSGSNDFSSSGDMFVQVIISEMNDLFDASTSSACSTDGIVSAQQIEGVMACGDKPSPLKVSKKCPSDGDGTGSSNAESTSGNAQTAWKRDSKQRGHVLGWMPLTCGGSDVAVYCGAPRLETGQLVYQSIMSKNLCVQVMIRSNMPYLKCDLGSLQ